MSTKKKIPFEKLIAKCDERFELIDEDGDIMDSFSTVEEAREMIQEIADDNMDYDKETNYYLVEKKLVGTFVIPKPAAVKVVYKAAK